ncbi:hypothetical protein Syun_019629 [Stephania yunnanensis]|uniref:Uncharacterized protein n=1 Tax=Stephania yunnanensis TaxID=152371 RepID=A0AAP0IWG6_9MAGN
MAPNPEPHMPNPMRREIDKMAMDCRNPTWVGSKKVNGNDVTRYLNRFVLGGAMGAKLDEFLGAEEKGNNLNTKMVDGDGKVWEMDFNYWTSLKKYVFKRHWVKILDKFRVKKGWIVQIWCFKSNQNKTCFGVNFVNPKRKNVLKPPTRK